MSEAVSLSMAQSWPRGTEWLIKQEYIDWTGEL